jgi:hypothetical protein
VGEHQLNRELPEQLYVIQQGGLKMFWKRNAAKKGRSPVKIDRLLSEIIGEEWSKVPSISDHWVEYKAVTRMHQDNGSVCDVRVFDEWSVKDRRVTVTGYESLDAHPDLIIFEGWLDRKARKGDIKLRKAA